MALVSGEFTHDLLAVGPGAAMEILVAIAMVEPFHVPHPEVIGEGPHLVDGLFEAHLDLKASAVKPDDFQRGQIQVCA